MVIWRLLSCQKHGPRSLRYQHQILEQKSNRFSDAIWFKLRLITLFKKLKNCLHHLRVELHWRRLLNSGAQNQKRHVTFARMSCRIPKRAMVQSCKPSSSFHEEAIADCLEFIKRNSMSTDDNVADSSTGALRA